MSRVRIPSPAFLNLAKWLAALLAGLLCRPAIHSCPPAPSAFRFRLSSLSLWERARVRAPAFRFPLSALGFSWPPCLCIPAVFHRSVPHGVPLASRQCKSKPTKDFPALPGPASVMHVMQVYALHAASLTPDPPWVGPIGPTDRRARRGSPDPAPSTRLSAFRFRLSRLHASSHFFSTACHWRLASVSPSQPKTSLRHLSLHT